MERPAPPLLGPTFPSASRHRRDEFGSSMDVPCPNPNRGSSPLGLGSRPPALGRPAPTRPFLKPRESLNLKRVNRSANKPVPQLQSGTRSRFCAVPDHRREPREVRKTGTRIPKGHDRLHGDKSLTPAARELEWQGGEIAVLPILQNCRCRRGQDEGRGPSRPHRGATESIQAGRRGPWGRQPRQIGFSS
ncbi:hypothetical protein SAMN05444166_1345 [Singulisphaera sp. GP187]|nr:hypothetical protein SAMN05444166_1345 [Singulisphaera sp. GP187]